MRADWPLVGRRDELARMAELLRRPDVGGVVVAGTSGVGKTRLIEECLALAEEAGFAVARVAATRAGATIPLGALAPLLPDLSLDADSGLLQRARTALAGLASGRPLVLAVDDAHLLDDASAVLLHQLAESDDVFVVVTVRNGERVPDPVVALWKDGLADRLDVSPLPEELAAELVVAALDGPMDKASLRSVMVASEGNPLILREVLLGAEQAGQLVSLGGVWRLQGRPCPRLRSAS